AASHQLPPTTPTPSLRSVGGRPPIPPECRRTGVVGGPRPSENQDRARIASAAAASHQLPPTTRDFRASLGGGTTPHTPRVSAYPRTDRVARVEAPERSAGRVGFRRDLPPTTHHLFPPPTFRLQALEWWRQFRDVLLRAPCPEASAETRTEGHHKTVPRGRRQRCGRPDGRVGRDPRPPRRERRRQDDPHEHPLRVVLRRRRPCPHRRGRSPL